MAWVEQGWGRPVDPLQAFLFGVMVAWSPSLLILAWLLLRAP